MQVSRQSFTGYSNMFLYIGGTKINGSPLVWEFDDHFAMPNFSFQKASAESIFYQIEIQFDFRKSFSWHFFENFKTSFRTETKIFLTRNFNSYQLRLQYYSEFQHSYHSTMT